MIDDIASLIGAVGASITAVGVILVAWWAYRAKERAADAAEKAAIAAKATIETNAKVTRIGTEIYELGQRVDGRLTELLAASISQARAEGISVGEETQRIREGL